MHAARSVQHTLYAIADVVLATYEEILDVTLAMHERPYRPGRPFQRRDGESGRAVRGGRGASWRCGGDGGAGLAAASLIGSSRAALSCLLNAASSPFTSASSLASSLSRRPESSLNTS